LVEKQPDKPKWAWLWNNLINPMETGLVVNLINPVSVVGNVGLDWLECLRGSCSFVVELTSLTFLTLCYLDNLINPLGDWLGCVAT